MVATDPSAPSLSIVESTPTIEVHFERSPFVAGWAAGRATGEARSAQQLQGADAAVAAMAERVWILQGRIAAMECERAALSAAGERIVILLQQHALDPSTEALLLSLAERSVLVRHASFVACDK